MINPLQIRKNLPTVAINQIAKQTGFTKRNDGKITPLNFILSFFVSIQKPNHSLKRWAIELSILLRQTISYNGMKYAQNKSRADFAKGLLEWVLQKKLAISSERSKLSFGTHLLDNFNRVFLEDSTCINLPSYLHPFFPGSFSHKGKAATAKIQLRQELKSGCYTHIALQCFRDNDQKFSPNILKSLQANDLVIRDLGYWVLDVFEQIIAIKAFFISRLRYGTNLYNCISKEKIDLAKMLRKASRNGIRIVELEALVGQKAQVKSRVVAIKCPHNVTRKRRKAARNNRNAKANHSQEYIELLGWTLLITNVDQQDLKPKELLRIYGYRWRIEIIFKCWKSHFNIHQLFNSNTKLTKEQVEITFYLFLVWLSLFFVKMYNYFLIKVFEQNQKVISLMKFAKFVNEHMSDFLSNPDLDYWIKHLAYFCSYKKRNDRFNFFELVFNTP